MTIKIKTIRERIQCVLETMSFEEYLEENSLTIEEVLEILILEGFLDLPENEPL
jgi:hypothetical protein